MLYRMNSSVPISAMTLRALKSIAIATLAAIFVLALGWPRSLASLWAQSATNPLIAPVPPPPAPAQLPAPVTTAIAPVLVPVPALPTASPTPSVRAFNCSCFGRATGTHWMGRVNAAGYFAARQSAVGACLSSNEEREPQSPFIATSPVSGFTTSVPALPGAAPPASAALMGQTLPGALDTAPSEQLEMCSNCVCD